MILTSAAMCLALTLYHEARSEPAVGQAAVAYVVLNRAHHQEKDVCNVVTAPKQFSYLNGKLTKLRWGWRIDDSLKPKDKTAWQWALTLARAALQMKNDPSRGAMFYHVVGLHPAWSKMKVKLGQIGRHVFYGG